MFRKLSVEDNLMAILQTLPTEPARAAGAHEPPDRATGTGTGPPEQRLRALGRRAAARGDRAQPGDRAEFPAAGRAVFRHRSDSGAGAAEDHLRPEAGRHRHPGDRSQRARDAGGDRSRLHHQQRPDFPLRFAGGAGRPIRKCGACTSAKISIWSGRADVGRFPPGKARNRGGFQCACGFVCLLCRRCR